MKVDRSFTAGLPHDQTSRKIVKTVAALAADMGLTCVVEGVEPLPNLLRCRWASTSKDSLPDAPNCQPRQTFDRF